jgi:hypothetical protein
MEIEAAVYKIVSIIRDTVSIMPLVEARVVIQSFLNFSVSEPPINSLIYFILQREIALAEIMRQPWLPLAKNGFYDLFAQKKTHKASVFEADSSQRWHDSIIFHEFVNQKARQKDFFENFGAVAL